MLLAISSPYARRGVLWEQYRRHHGVDGSPVLTWTGTSREMNPGLSEAVVTRALEEDERAARADYLAEFRRDVETYISREAVEAVVVPGRRGLPPIQGQRYYAFCDPSGGAADSMTLAIAHREKKVAVLDLVREIRPPFSPEDAVAEFTSTAKFYGVSRRRCSRRRRWRRRPRASHRRRIAGLNPRTHPYHHEVPIGARDHGGRD